MQKNSQLIGNTPLLELSIRSDSWQLFGKMEMFNPGGSIKDRSALGLILDAEKRNVLRPGMTIIESTSGNTGIALAMLAAERGYKLIAVADHHGLPEKLNKIKALGATLHLCDTSALPPGQVGTDVRRQIAQEMAAEREDYICLNQYDNLANPAFYAETLGEEIWADTSGRIDLLIGTVGTGSALSGVAEKLKEYNPSIKICGVEPDGSIIFGKPGKPYFQSGPGFPANSTLPQNVAYDLIDRNYQITDQEAFNTMRSLASKGGLFVGDSAGAALYQAMKIIQQDQSPRAEKKTAVVLVCDGGQYYMSHAYNDGWMQEHQLIDPAISAEIEAFYCS